MWAFAPGHTGPDGVGYLGNATQQLAARLADDAVLVPPGGIKGPGTVPFFLTAVPLPGNAEQTNRDGNAGAIYFGVYR